MIREARPRHRLRQLLGAVLLSLVGLLLVAGIKSYRELQSVRRHEARLVEEIRLTDERARELARRIQRLQHDPRAQEREVRRSLRWVRPGEIVLLVDEPPPAPAAPDDGSAD